VHDDSTINIVVPVTITITVIIIIIIIMVNVLQERDNFAARCDECKRQLNAQKTGSKHLEDLIDKLHQDKKRLSLRVSKLTTTGMYIYIYIGGPIHRLLAIELIMVILNSV